MQDDNNMLTGHVIDQARFEADKRAVYKHPLFSLLALLLEKCECATQGYSPATSSQTSSSPSSTNPNSTNCDSFQEDIQAFVKLLEKEKRPLLTNNTELDGLMIKALQVLRIHLLELEKVQELCRDFCSRYIACLRGKMQSENLLRSDYPLESNLSNSNSPINTPEQQDQLTNQLSTFYSNNNEYQSGSEIGEYNVPSGGFNLPTAANAVSESSFVSSDSDKISSNGHRGVPSVAAAIAAAAHLAEENNLIPVANQPPAPVQAVETSGQINLSDSSTILGTTPIGQIGCQNFSLDHYNDQLSPCGSSDEADSEIDSNNDDLSSNFSTNSSSKRQKRGILPRQATSVMRSWLFQHLVHPYPTEDEKRAIAAQTNLTLLQVNNWFINARRRILQPMLEQASDGVCNTSSLKSPSRNSPPKRFWSDNVESPTNFTTSSSSDKHQKQSNNDNASANNSGEDQTSSKLDESYYNSEEESNSSLVIDHEC